MKHERIFNITAHRPFASVLASHILARYGDQPEALPHLLILLPNRRAIRSLRERFLALSGGKAMLLPQMEAIGDVDERLLLRHASLDAAEFEALQSLPPAISEEARLFTLMRLVQQYQQQEQQREQVILRGQAADTASALADFLDEMQREGGEWSRLREIVPQEHAAQWQQTLDFLTILQEHWPDILAEKGQMDIWERRNRLLALLAQSWQRTPPERPVYIAGTTGSIPAVAGLLRVVSLLPQGRIILPGMDRELLGREEAPLLEEAHPQYGLQHLLGYLGVKAQEVAELEGEGEPSTDTSLISRAEWLAGAMLPPELTGEWHQPELALPAEAVIAGNALLECHDMSHEAAVIALLLRQTLETPGKTAALVTLNRDLSRRIRYYLERWGIQLDDSAGTPLAQTPAGEFIRLMGEAVQQQFAPVTLLSLLKHPLLRLGQLPATIRPQVRQIERRALRGLPMGSGLDYLAGHAALDSDDKALIDALRQAFAPVQTLYATQEAQPMRQWLDAFMAVAEALSRDAEGQPLIYQGEEAVTLTEYWQKLADTADIAAPVSLEEFLAVMRILLTRQLHRAAYGTHPRLSILSPMEARLQHFDRVILADLNEGSWPAVEEVNPWLNRPLSREIGLAAPERKIGLLTHDFCQLVSACPEVFFTRAVKSGGTMTIPARFLLRMEALLSLYTQKNDETAVERWKSHAVLNWAEQLDMPQMRVYLPRPAPKPPVKTRPRRLSATQIEKLMLDPYGIYARMVLRLRVLDPLEMELDNREFGNALHRALEWFIEAEGWKSPDAESILHQKLQAAFAPYRHFYVVEALWLPRLEKIAAWLLQQPFAPVIASERDGSVSFTAPAGPFEVTARVDRVDVTPERWRFIDYKTGQAPKAAEQQLGLKNQLLIAGWIAEQGGYGADWASRPAAAMEYWQLSGGRDGSKIVSVLPAKAELGMLQAMIRQMAERLPQLIARFDNPETAYEAVPDPQNLPRFNDYAHLARISEWENHA